MDDYLKFIKSNKKEYSSYYKKGIEKTEQQKFLEKLILEYEIDIKSKIHIGDIACGGGTLTYHLSKLFTNSSFTLLDYNKKAVELAQELNGIDNCTFKEESIYDIQIPDNSMDIVCCWQTLSWIDDPECALNELLRITKPGGYIFASALFNIDHDVDLYTSVLDHTKKGNVRVNYFTYSNRLINEWLKSKVNEYRIHKFEPEIDFTYDGRGIGTFTKKCDDGTRIQISAGILLNWGILVIKK